MLAMVKPPSRTLSGHPSAPSGEINAEIEEKAKFLFFVFGGTKTVEI